MLEDFTYDFLLQVQGKTKVNLKKIDYHQCEECNGFYLCPSCGVCGNDIFVIGYDESTVMHKKGNVFIREMNIFSRKLDRSYVENLLRSLIE